MVILIDETYVPSKASHWIWERGFCKRMPILLNKLLIQSKHYISTTFMIYICTIHPICLQYYMYPAYHSIIYIPYLQQLYMQAFEQTQGPLSFHRTYSRDSIAWYIRSTRVKAILTKISIHNFKVNIAQIRIAMLK